MIFLYYFTIVLLAKCHFSNAEADDELVVTLNKPNSTIRGHILQSNNGKDYYAFQDIPYALPPIGNLRFQESQPHTGWEGILNTTENTKKCIQTGFGVEDCLVLNVFSPVKPGSKQLPVFFWIHGGAFKRGYCDMVMCGPAYLMDYDVVVVTVLYRLGPFGFLTTEDDVIPGNMGLKDQLLALKWVNENIALFGGDPSRVTIGGQSAGSISTSCHVISQKATGLFRAAIIESGTALVHGSYISTARNYAFQLGKLVQPSFNSNSSEELLKILQSASADDIIAVNTEINRVANQVGLLDDLNWGLVVETFGKNPYLTAPFEQKMLEGNYDKVPILTGYTSEEILAFVTNVDDIYTSAAFYDKNDSSIVYDKLHVSQENVPLVGKNLKEIYTNETFVKDVASYVAFSSDIAFSIPTIRQAALSAKDVPVYLYEFSFKGSAHAQFNYSIPNVNGVAHTEELGYMWTRVELKTDADRAVSKMLLQLWTNFITFLNPTPNATDPVLGNFSWPRVTDRNNVEYVNISETLAIRTNPHHYNAVKDLFEKYAQAPFIIF